MTAAKAPASDPVQDALFRAIPHVLDPPLNPPEHGDTSWRRAQTEADRGGVLNEAERMVFLEGSDEPKRVVFALVGSTLRSKCGCRSFQYRDWCAHVASCWWRWVRGEIDVYHVDLTGDDGGRVYRDPPPWLRLGQTAPGVDEDALRDLPPKQLETWLHCEYGPEGPRPFARRTDRSPGTISNQLRHARNAVGRVE